MTNNAALALLLLALSACHDSGHPEGRGQVPELEGRAVATIDGRRITAAEATAFASERESPTTEEFVEREVLAQAAIEDGLDAELVRKRAMVRAYLADEVEAKVTEEDIPKDLLATVRAEVKAELEHPGGFDVVAVRVYARELLKGTVSAERRGELVDKLGAVTERLWDSVPDEDGVSAALSLDTKTEDPGITINILELKLASAGSNPVRGFSRAPRLAAALLDVPDGGKSPIFVTKDSPVFVVRRSRIEPTLSPPEEIERVTTERALTKVRTDRMAELLDGLREKAVVVTHLEAFEEEL